MHKTALLLFLSLASLTAFGQTGGQFSRAAVLADLDTLRRAVTEAHYNPHAYTTAATLDSAFWGTKAAIDQDSFNLLETTNLLQRFVATVKNGHTAIDFPIQSYIEYAYAGGTVLPLEIAFEDGRPLVRKNWSERSDIAIGAEVLSINGRPIAELLDRIYPQIAGERRYYQRAKLEAYSFPRYYWQVFGEQAEFRVALRVGETITEYILPAVSVIEGYEMKRTEVLDPTKKLTFFGATAIRERHSADEPPATHGGIRLTRPRLENPMAAFLNPGGFGGDETQYQRFIDSAFAEIRTSGSKNLIIDLRNNPGGNDSFSDYLVAYLADRPFRWNARFTLKTSSQLKAHVRANQDTTTAYAREILAHRDGAVYEYEFPPYAPQPKAKRFTGSVYVLVNRQSHSQAAVTAAQIQDYGFGTIVGEETAEYPSLYASIFPYVLPRTGITVQLSKGHIVRVNGSTAAAGVIPDIFIRDHLLDGEDEILAGLLALIAEQG